MTSDDGEYDVNEVVKMSLYDIVNLLAISMEEDDLESDYIELRCFDNEAKSYNLKVILEKEK